MDIEKLIERLNAYSAEHQQHGGITAEAADALSTLQAENEEMQKQLNMFSEFLCYMTGGLLSKTNYTAQEMISAAEDYQQNVCGECDLRAENEKLRAELEQVKRERDAIEQDFRAFAKQWWEQDSGFPCRWCKFENSGGCEWKAKQPNEEKICAGRAFEWRGQRED